MPRRLTSRVRNRFSIAPGISARHAKADMSQQSPNAPCPMSDGVMPSRTSTARMVRRASSDAPSAALPTAAAPRRHLTPDLGVLSCPIDVSLAGKALSVYVKQGQLTHAPQSRRLR